jgi:hypothetical protein
MFARARKPAYTFIRGQNAAGEVAMQKLRAGGDLAHQQVADSRFFSLYLWPGSRTEAEGRRPTIRVHKITIWLLINALLWVGILRVILWTANAIDPLSR